jgi:glutamate 5-kinase
MQSTDCISGGIIMKKLEIELLTTGEMVDKLKSGQLAICIEVNLHWYTGVKLRISDNKIVWDSNGSPFTPKENKENNHPCWIIVKNG